MLRMLRKQASASALRQLSRIEQVARVGLWEWNKTSGEVSWSGGCYRVFGRNPDTFKPDQENIFRCIHPEDIDEFLVKVAFAEEQQIPFSLTFRVLWEDGTLHWVQCAGETERNNAREVIGLAGTVQDVTEYKKRMDSSIAKEQVFRRLANSMPALLIYLDAEQRYRFVNREWERWHNRSAEEVLGQRINDVISDQAYKLLKGPIYKALSGRAHSFKSNFEFPAVGLRFVQGDYVPDISSDGDVVGMFILAVDLTEQHAVEESLRSYADELNATARLQEDFLAMLSHEIRNPLTPILYAGELLKRLSEKPDPSQLAWLSQLIIDRASHLTALVDDLLDVGRLTRDEIPLRIASMDLRPIIVKATEAAQKLAAEQDQRILLESSLEPLPVEGDAVRMLQIFDNLLGNALKYTPGHGEIRVSACAENGEAVIRVRDTGCGISSDYLTEIFKRFNRRDTQTARGKEGLGLGLYVCKQLVERQGGSIEAHSAGAGQGTEFTVRFPLATPAATPTGTKDTTDPTETVQTAARAETTEAVETEKTEAGHEASDKAPPCRVLIIDDDEAVAHSTSTLLEALGHQTEVAADGPGGLRAVPHFGPDLILLDIGLPGMDGYEVARLMRESYPDSGFMLVAVTGYGQASDAEKALNSGFDRHLTKPVSVTDLEEVLRAVSCPVLQHTAEELYQL